MVEALGDLEDLCQVGRLVGPGADGVGAETVQAALLQWYDANRRQLPWRGDACAASWCRTVAESSSSSTSETSSSSSSSSSPPSPPSSPSMDGALGRRAVSPYETWVSEVMLQQTRVATVVGFFERWMTKFPTVQALAAATPEEVNASWAGLGYYSRCRNLHAGAKKVVGELGGAIPGDVEALLGIPGIGEYTAGAVASIAFGRAVPLVDGNVIRVFSRLCAAPWDAKNRALVKGCWRLGRALVPAQRPGDFNQALMELGATVCTPKAPNCASCPLRAVCRAHAEDPASVTRFPAKAAKKTLPEESYAVAVVSRARQAVCDAAGHAGSQGAGGGLESLDSETATLEYLLQRRPESGLLAGQWEFLRAKVKGGPAETGVSEESRRAALKEAGVGTLPCGTCEAGSEREDHGMFTHTFTHLRHHLHVETLLLPSPSRSSAAACACKAPKKPLAWMTQAEMALAGLPKSTQQCLDIALGKTKTKTKAKTKAKTKETKAKTKTTTKAKAKTKAKANTTKTKTKSKTTTPKRKRSSADAPVAASSASTRTKRPRAAASQK